MSIINELEDILNKHECPCYKLDKENLKLIYVGMESECLNLHKAIAEVTGHLLLNGIDYKMTVNNDIHINTKEKFTLKSLYNV